MTFTEEAGAVTVIVAMMLVVLLGMAALAIDVGALYLERRELQNGADAAALAIAQDCATDATSANCTSLATALTTARTYADANARDSAATVGDGGVVFDYAASKVTVTADTNDPSSADTSKLAHWFAPVLGYDATAVSATGAAIWGPIAAGSLQTLPIAMSLCEYEEYLDQPGTRYPAEEPWSSASPTDPEPYDGNGKPMVIFLHGTGDPCTGPSGQELPGGFGWLDTDSTCEYVGDGWMAGDTGANVPSDCKKSEFTAELLGKVIELPVFKDARGTGSSIEYEFNSYAAFYVAGYNFPSMSDYLTDPYTGKLFECIKPDGSKCTGTDRHIIGWFTTSLDSTSTEVDLSAPDTGVNTTQLVLE